ncbi:hypothetical protein Slin15195_G045100 [Septoria linicola]|uniref:GPI anchored protein n=1 Tax=Septoria linicola TaxID=215465 RepID=A0A9Q9AV11_9PEZI|nr:hypothetical protein Slin14017_G048620 [Septoria linicola]USW51191.1 hypothetical protein Slin15195_G045100 [Septoria linicola]
MLFKNLSLLGLAALAVAQNDNDNDNDNTPQCLEDGDTDGCSTAVATSTELNGIVVTSLATTTDVGESTTLVPVLTQSVDTTTDVGVSTSRNTLTETTDIGTTPTNTQYATTTDVNLQSGYAYTTDSSGQTIATYTGTDRNAASTVPVAGNDNDNMSSSTTDSGVMATAVPYLGAAAMAGLAYVL